MPGKYPLIPIVLIITFLYAISYIFSRLGIISSKIHSRIWNTALLISFLVAGILGFIMVIQINYKIDISIVETIMQYHVDFGISLFLISVFHILLHLDYFKQLLKIPSSFEKKEIRKISLTTYEEPSRGITQSKIIFSIFTLGISSMISQIIVLREFVSVFTGNELIIGITLSNWLILTGLGSYLFHQAFKIIKNSGFLLVMHGLTGFLPFFTLSCLYALKNIIFPVGMQVNYVQFYFFSLLLLAPLCLTCGLAFSCLNKTLSEIKNRQMVNKSYAYESLGSLAGSLLFSFILIFYLNSFQIFSILLLLNLIAIYLYTQQNFSLPKKIIILSICVTFVSSAFLINIESLTKNFLFPSQRIVSIDHSPYGQMIITENEGQMNFFQNGIYVFSTDSGKIGNTNIASDEESVHFTMVQHNSPRDILCISGGIGGIIHEILKYNVKSVDLLEIDPIISKLALKFNLDINDSSVRLINMDFREFLYLNKKTYDVIFINVPPPMGTETNRFYTVEFFESLKKIMNEESFVCLSLTSTFNYIDSISLWSNRLIYNTLKYSFKNICIFPGEKNYFIASAYPIHQDVVERLVNKSIKNEYVAYYLDDFSIKARSEMMMKQIIGPSAINKDLKPMSYFIYLYQQLNMFRGSYWLLAVFMLIFFTLILRKFNRIRFVMFTAGFASISAELIILYLFQMIFGMAYQYISLVFAFFMAGLVIGPLLPSSYPTQKKNVYLPLVMFILGLIVTFSPIFLKYSVSGIKSGYFLQFIFLFLILIVATFSGHIFKIVGHTYYGQSTILAGETYSADLYGSAFGAIVISIVVVPFAGILYSGILPGVLCTFSTGLMYFTNKSKKLNIEK